LNTQFKASLLELNDDGALMVADYKMKILKKCARNERRIFFGKSGWTLHTILVFQNSNDGNLDIQAYDHWSEDEPKMLGLPQTGCFDAVFTMMECKPKWVKIISDNGAHYNNSQLMMLIAHWYDWYKIDVKSWIFLEPGEAKTTVDSHHASVCY